MHPSEKRDNVPILQSALQQFNILPVMLPISQVGIVHFQSPILAAERINSDDSQLFRLLDDVVQAVHRHDELPVAETVDQVEVFQRRLDDRGEILLQGWEMFRKVAFDPGDEVE